MRKYFVFGLILLFGIALFVGCFLHQDKPDDRTAEQRQEENNLDEEELLDDESEDPSEEDEPGETPESTIPDGQLTVVYFIDVGQGDAILIRTPTQNVLVDGGERGATVVDYLRSQGVNSLDLMIGTHPHADHIGGLINVMQAIPVKEVIDPAVIHTTKTFEDYLTIIDQKDIKFTEGRAGMARDLGGGATMQILHPSAPSGTHLNDASIVVKLTFGRVSFMLTGDAEQAGEAQILNRGYDLKSTILKAGHHGSRTSTTRAFLNAVTPEAAVIMCAANNSYGHPHEETLQKLATAGVDIYRTDIHGTIIITTDGRTYQVNKQPFTFQQQPQPPPATSEGSYVGSVKSDKYHYPSCRWAQNINPENKIWFGSVAEAKAAGYSPCGTCRPPGN